MPDQVGGPYLSVAVLCERVLQEQDGVPSIIRIVDRLIVSPGANAPEKMPPITVTTTAFLSFKAGTAQGQLTAKLTIESPSGNESVLGTFPLLFEGNDRGVNLVFNLNLQIQEQGLYWIGVYLEEELKTRVPLRILYQRIGVGS